MSPSSIRAAQVVPARLGRVRYVCARRGEATEPIIASGEAVARWGKFYGNRVDIYIQSSCSRASQAGRMYLGGLEEVCGIVRTSLLLDLSLPNPQDSDLQDHKSSKH